ncbi:hypothetical protein [Variovorax sp. YR566]|uniref:hypothetical protein n=1 Tax=Variovorax sp. YR566 TaxID=3450237 RepID=UPI003F817931
MYDQTRLEGIGRIGIAEAPIQWPVVARVEVELSHREPLGEVQMGGDHHTCVLVPLREQMERKPSINDALALGATDVLDGFGIHPL